MKNIKYIISVVLLTLIGVLGYLISPALFFGEKEQKEQMLQEIRDSIQEEGNEEIQKNEMQEENNEIEDTLYFDTQENSENTDIKWSDGPKTQFSQNTPGIFCKREEITDYGDGDTLTITTREYVSEVKVNGAPSMVTLNISEYSYSNKEYGEDTTDRELVYYSKNETDKISHSYYWITEGRSYQFEDKNQGQYIENSTHGFTPSDKVVFFHQVLNNYESTCKEWNPVISVLTPSSEIDFGEEAYDVIIESM